MLSYDLLFLSFVEKLIEQRRYSEAALLLDQYAKVSFHCLSPEQN